MEAESAQLVWRRLLPDAVSFSVGFAPTSSAVSVAEHDSLGDVAPARLREFAAGRWHARRALAAIGHRAVELPRRADGAPAWPEGVVGSISHAACGERSFVIAAVARRAEVLALGVDLEPPGRIAPRQWPGLLAPGELAHVLSLDVPARGIAVHATWCAKEAASKALGGMTAPGRVEIVFDADSGDFSAAFVARSTGSGAACSGRVVIESGWSCAAVVCPVL